MEYKNINSWQHHYYTLDTIDKNRIIKFKKVMSLMPPTGKVLDVGCGNGALHELLKERGYTDVTGFDFTERFINEAKKSHPGYKYNVQDACKKFRYKDNSFDIIICVELLEHVASPYIVLENMYNVCKRGGCVILSTPNGLLREIKNLTQKEWKVPKNVFQYLTPGVLEGMIREIGGKVVYSNWGKLRLGHIYIKFIK